MTDVEKHALAIRTETTIDIALMAGYMISRSEIEIDDSRELVSNISEWAEEFELVTMEESARSNPDEADTWDYLIAVDEFAERKLLERYGVKK